MAIAAAFGIAGNNAYADIIPIRRFEGNLPKLCDDVAKKSGLRVVKKKHHKFENGVETIALVLSESALIAVRQPAGPVTISIYTCGKEGKPSPAVEKFCKAFPGAQTSENEIKRGDVPVCGIRRWKKATNAENILAVVDNLYKRRIKDDLVVDMIRNALIGVADPKNIFELRHDFKPQGMTAVFVAIDRNGRPITIDVHTYPENKKIGKSGEKVDRPYVSFTISGEAETVQNVTKKLKRQDMPLAAANQPVYPRLVA